MTRNLSAPWVDRAISGAIAGIVGGLAHAAMNEIDRRVLNYNADDLIMLGGIFTDDSNLARRVGLGMHLNFAAMFGAAYGVLLYPKNSDDALRKAVGFAMFENVTLFPLGVLVDGHHPYAKAGRSDKFFNPTSFVQASLRHLTLGVGIGKAYPLAMRLIRNQSSWLRYR